MNTTMCQRVICAPNVGVAYIPENKKRVLVCSMHYLMWALALTTEKRATAIHEMNRRDR